MTPEYILRHSLCRAPHCAGPSELRDTPFKEWPEAERAKYLRQADSAIEEINFAAEYGEPGYTNPEKGILFGNWNYFSREVADLLAKVGYELEWEDEWTTCGNCGKALRTQADSHGWQPSYFEQDCSIYCVECVDVEEFLAGKEDDPRTALNDHIDPSQYGYTKLEGDFESGLHAGMNDDPNKIYDRLKTAGHKRLLFMIDEVSQFYMTFSVWKKQPYDWATGQTYSVVYETETDNEIAAFPADCEELAAAMAEYLNNH